MAIHVMFRSRGGRRLLAVMAMLAACGCAPAAASPGGNQPAFPRPADLGRVDVTIVYDDEPYNPDLPLPGLDGTGFLIETGTYHVVFDCGNDGSQFMENLARLGKDPRQIDAVVISHFAHGHWGALPNLLAVNPDLPVYLADAPPDELIARLGNAPPRNWILAKEPTEVVPGIFTTGQSLGSKQCLGQSLAAHTPLGPFLVVGCGNPNWEAAARGVTFLAGMRPVLAANLCSPDGTEPPYAKRRRAIALWRTGVRYVGAHHCTLRIPLVMQALHDGWDDRCLHLGNGALIRFDQGAAAPIVGPAPLAGRAGSRAPQSHLRRGTGDEG